MGNTLDYYNQNAEAFFNNTAFAEMYPIWNRFLAYIPEGGLILDLGSGSGRDSKAFLDAGYRVVAVDGSEELAKLASAHIGQEVICSSFQDYEPTQTFDGIWACASLLHLSLEDIEPVMKKMADSLNEHGCFYVSFKYGTFSGERNGRYFTDMTLGTFSELLKKIPELEIEQQFITVDARPGREDEQWLNVILSKRDDKLIF